MAGNSLAIIGLAFDLVGAIVAMAGAMVRKAELTDIATMLRRHAGLGDPGGPDAIIERFSQASNSAIVGTAIMAIGFALQIAARVA